MEHISFISQINMISNHIIKTDSVNNGLDMILIREDKFNRMLEKSQFFFFFFNEK